MKTASPRLPCCFDHNCELGCTSQMYSGRVWKAERRCMPGPCSLCFCPTRKQGHRASDVASPVMVVKIQLVRCHWLGFTFQQALKGDSDSSCRSWLPGFLATLWPCFGSHSSCSSNNGFLYLNLGSMQEATGLLPEWLTWCPLLALPIDP